MTLEPPTETVSCATTGVAAIRAASQDTEGHESKSSGRLLGNRANRNRSVQCVQGSVRLKEKLSE